MIINCVKTDAEVDAICDLEEQPDEFSITIESPRKAYASARLFVCKDCKRKAFILIREAEEPHPEALFGGQGIEGDGGADEAGE